MVIKEEATSSPKAAKDKKQDKGVAKKSGLEETTPTKPKCICEICTCG